MFTNRLSAIKCVRKYNRIKFIKFWQSPMPEQRNHNLKIHDSLQKVEKGGQYRVIRNGFQAIRLQKSQSVSVAINKPRLWERINSLSTKLAWITVFSLYIHCMITTCSLYVHYMFTICSLYIHHLFIICLLYIHYRWQCPIFRKLTSCTNITWQHSDVHSRDKWHFNLWLGFSLEAFRKQPKFLLY